jgi:hypothetical protein
MQRVFTRFAIIGTAFAALVGMSALVPGQPGAKSSRQPASPHRIGVPDDWSHHHLVFSNPGTYEQAAKSGAAYAKWLTIRYDTRFILQQMKRRAEAAGGISSDLSTKGSGAVSPLGIVGPEDLAIGLLRQLPGEAKAKPKPVPKPNPKPKPSPRKGLWIEPMLTGTVQPNAYPAKWGASLTSASCSDFVVYPTGVTSASIVVYNNLYADVCGETVAAVYGAYYTDGNNSIYTAYGGPATVSTSPIISEDGSQLAFIQSNGTDSSSLVLMQLAPSGTLLTPSTPIVVYRTSYRGCSSLPCMTELGWGVPSDYPGDLYTYSDTFSAPFYDYSSDALYVGDDKGYLYKFEGIFGGTPTQPPIPPTGTRIWPLRLTTINKLTSPVYDPVSGLIFVGDTGGYLYAVGSGNQSTQEGTLYATSAQLGDAIMDAPLVDSTAGMVYVFVTTDSHGMNTVYQFPTGFANGASGNSVEVGKGGAGYYLYAGDFDNVYYSSSTPGSPSGNLYVVGNTGDTTDGATLYRIPITSNVMGTPNATVTGLTASGEYPWPSPLTEFCNNSTSACDTNGKDTTSGTDYLFFSVNAGIATKCGAFSGNGCLLSYNITTPSSSLPTPASLNVANVTSPGCWATGGLVIDNTDTTNNGAQVYFMALSGNTAGGAGGVTSGNCQVGSGKQTQAYQASQAALK